MAATKQSKPLALSLALVASVALLRSTAGPPAFAAPQISAGQRSAIEPLTAEKVAPRAVGMASAVKEGTSSSVWAWAAAAVGASVAGAASRSRSRLVAAPRVALLTEDAVDSSKVTMNIYLWGEHNFKLNKSPFVVIERKQDRPHKDPVFVRDLFKDKDGKACQRYLRMPDGRIFVRQAGMNHLVLKKSKSRRARLMKIKELRSHEYRIYNKLMRHAFPTATPRTRPGDFILRKFSDNWIPKRMGMEDQHVGTAMWT